MKNFTKISLAVVIALGSASATLWAYTRYFNDTQVIAVNQNPAMQYASLPSAPQGDAPDLTYAAESSVHAVVHVKVKSKVNMSSYGNPFFDWFYGDRFQQQPQIRQGAGSGVIISPDGYIVTNNHVIDDADQVTVALNDKREFEAKLVGADETTDIALLKVDADELPTIRFGSSDRLKLGEWVLAVGNPFNLTSTVTAGIVSAKGRSLNINQAAMSIEAFIQTDAAVNPGNSGGALVNMNGELVGINTAIASQTGSYTGYSFAVPSSIVQKVVSDLKEFGRVQRAILGVSIGEVDAKVAKDYNLDKIEGVFVGGTTPGSGAEEAGIKKGDVILSINDVVVNSPAQLQEQIGKQRPGDVVKVLIKRDNKPKQFKVTLRNMHGDTGILKANDDGFLGAKFENVTENDRYKFRIQHGIKIVSLKQGKLKDAGLKPGFIITHVNKQEVKGVYDFERIIRSANGGILIEGIYPNGERAYFVFGSDN
ncbi:MAG: Do family serine endopeptidase [Mangrovibacterium sp.]|nr:Do family serine endopeptidase [Mangrovibacterium sp.]